MECKEKLDILGYTHKEGWASRVLHTVLANIFGKEQLLTTKYCHTICFSVPFFPLEPIILTKHSINRTKHSIIFETTGRGKDGNCLATRK